VSVLQFYDGEMLVKGAFVPQIRDFVLLGVPEGGIGARRGAGLAYPGSLATRFLKNAASWKGFFPISRRRIAGRYGTVGAGDKGSFRRGGPY